MLYNALLKRKCQAMPVKAVMELEIPDNLDDLNKKIFAAHIVMEEFDIVLEPILPEKKDRRRRK